MPCFSTDCRSFIIFYYSQFALVSNSVQVPYAVILRSTANKLSAKYGLLPQLGEQRSVTVPYKDIPMCSHTFIHPSIHP
uniref:Uncharacterized protein n=1 Tax=Anguilla anguilla TaxID=7936 RepID=A0A0E9VGX6_ANGAN